MQVQPYVFFNGRCEEALKFYGDTLGAQVLFQMRYKEAPPDAQARIRPEFADKIMHASVQLGSSVWMASDGHCEANVVSTNAFNLSLTADDAASAQRYFDALADGGSITLPFQATFWSEGFGMLTDRFGIGWMVTVPQA